MDQETITDDKFVMANIKLMYIVKNFLQCTLTLKEQNNKYTELRIDELLSFSQSGGLASKLIKFRTNIKNYYKDFKGKHENKINQLHKEKNIMDSNVD